MNHTASLAVLSTCLSLSSGIAVNADSIDAGLRDVMETAQADEVVSVLVYLWEQADVDQLSRQLNESRADRRTRHRDIARTLRDTAELTQRNLLNTLDAIQRLDGIERYEPFWIANIIRVDATTAVIERLAKHPDVQLVFYNMPIEIISPKDEANHDRKRGADAAIALSGRAHRTSGVTTATVEPGVEAVRASEVWTELGYTGRGILVAAMDTGVDGTHPALADRWRGLDPKYHGNPEWAWFDQIYETIFPTEFAGSSHGTHVMGTVVGGSPGDQIGVAPGAQWMHAGVIDQGGVGATIANAILAYQWMAAPTGDPDDTWAVPHVCSNSWGTTAAVGHPNCDETFWQWIDNSEAMGTVQLFAAGNSGNQGLIRPADRATDDFRNLAVAAINPHDPSWPVMSFSSKGPTECTPDGSEAIKPDIAAPGAQIRSALADGGYGNKNGTSMAAPHVNGVFALMFEACPDLTVEQAKQILYETAVDLGPEGKDNSYGWGMVDAYQAVLNAEQSCALLLKLPDGAPSQLEPDVPTSFSVLIVESQEQIESGTEQLFYRMDSSEPFQSVPLASLGANLYEATLPPMECGSAPEFYISVEGDGGSVRTSPLNAPTFTYTAIVGDTVTTLVQQVTFDDGLPPEWKVTGLWNVTDECEISGECAGTQWAYYGNAGSCHYATGSQPNSGAMTSAPITVPTLPPGATATLRFCYNLDVEASPMWDVATFSILTHPYSVQFSNRSEWTTHAVDVTWLAGNEVQLEWHFDTVDGLANSSHGWQISNVTLEVTMTDCDDPIPGDLNGDGVVDVDDLFILLAAWGKCADPDDCPADLDGNGVVDVDDLFILLANWG